MDILYDISKTFIFHNDWELRHGALIYIRAFSRAFKKNRFTTSIPRRMLTPTELSVACELVTLVGRGLKDKAIGRPRVIADKPRLEELRAFVAKLDLGDLENKEAFVDKCEDVKNRCLILLAVDRFSDFLADKSNIINRALASEVLVNVFELKPNLTENFFIFEHLLDKDIKSGWEPKQAIFFLLTQILNSQKETFAHKERKNRRERKRKKRAKRRGEGQSSAREQRITKNYLLVSENLGQMGRPEQEPRQTRILKKIRNKKHKNLENLKLMEQELEFETFFREKHAKFLKGPVIDESNLGRILTKVTQVLTQHEEISETCCEFLLSVLGAQFFVVPEQYWLTAQKMLNEALLRSEDISYLPKSAFEFLIEILKKGIPLHQALRDCLDQHLNKFMFHENREVRRQVYLFVNQLFTRNGFYGRANSRCRVRNSECAEDATLLHDLLFLRGPQSCVLFGAGRLQSVPAGQRGPDFAEPVEEGQRARDQRVRRHLPNPVQNAGLDALDPQRHSADAAPQSGRARPGEPLRPNRMHFQVQPGELHHRGRPPENDIRRFQHFE